MARPTPTRKRGVGELRLPDSHKDRLYIGHLQVLRKFYEQGKDGMAALEAVIFAWEAGLYPPTWACDAVVPGLREFIDSEGDKSLEVALKLRPAVPVKGPPEKKPKQRSYEYWLYFRVWLFKKLTGVSIERSAAAVVGRESDRADIGAYIPKASSMPFKFSTWNKVFEQSDRWLLDEMKSNPQSREDFLLSILPDTRVEFLKIFPRDKDREKVYNAFPTDTFPKHLL